MISIDMKLRSHSIVTVEIATMVAKISLDQDDMNLRNLSVKDLGAALQ